MNMKDLFNEQLMWDIPLLVGLLFVSFSELLGGVMLAEQVIPYPGFGLQYTR